MNIAQYKNKVVSAGFDEETTRVLLGLEFQIHGDQAYVDSLQIADRLGIGHNDLLKVIRKFIEEEVELDLGNISHISNQPIIGVIESTYTDTQNRKQVLYLLNEINTLIIIMKSNSKN